MNVKELIFGGGVKTANGGGAYRDSIQAWLPIKNIRGGVVVTRDNRFIKILEVLPVNIYLKSANDRQNIIAGYAAWLKIAPDNIQLEARTLPADTADYPLNIYATSSTGTEWSYKNFGETSISPSFQTVTP